MSTNENIAGRGGNDRREEPTFHEFSLLFGELVIPVGLEEAVVPKATRVRQALNYCVQEALS